MATGTQLEKTPPPVPGRMQTGGRLPGLLGLIRVRWAQMAAAQRGWVVVSALMLIGLIGGLTWYAMSPDWRTLYMNLDPDDARQIGQTLTQAQIPFEAIPRWRGHSGSRRATGQGAPRDRGQGRREERTAGF